LTKEHVSVDNHGGRNWGAENGADINQFKMTTKAENEAEMQAQRKAAAAAARAAARAARGEVRVPEDCNTLNKAVDRVLGDDRFTVIVLGKGDYYIDVNDPYVGDYLEIRSAMSIVGDPYVPKEEIVVMGGIHFKEGIQGDCHLQHLTVRQAGANGVWADSSFTMDDVLVEQCGDSGVVAIGTGVVVQCTNVEVRQCGGSGVNAYNGASIALIGDKTSVQHNCTDGDSKDYGLTEDSASTIQLVFPLTKEQVSLNNGGGGNWRMFDGDRGGTKTTGKWVYDGFTIDLGTNCVEVLHGPNNLERAVEAVLGNATLKTVDFNEGKRKIFTIYVESNCVKVSSLEPKHLYHLEHAVKAVLSNAILETVDFNEGERSIFTIYIEEEGNMGFIQVHKDPNKQGNLEHAVNKIRQLETAMKTKNKDKELRSIVLTEGKHFIIGDYLEINSTMNIMGNPEVPKSEIVVMGGIRLQPEIRGGCKLSNLTVDGSFDKNGEVDKTVNGVVVMGKHITCRFEEIVVQNFKNNGVFVKGENIECKFFDVEVKQCEWCGMVALDGARLVLYNTRVHHNCTAFNLENTPDLEHSPVTNKKKKKNRQKKKNQLKINLNAKFGKLDTRRRTEIDPETPYGLFAGVSDDDDVISKIHVMIDYTSLNYTYDEAVKRSEVILSSLICENYGSKNTDNPDRNGHVVLVFGTTKAKLEQQVEQENSGIIRKEINMLEEMKEKLLMEKKKLETPPEKKNPHLLPETKNGEFVANTIKKHNQCRKLRFM